MPWREEKQEILQSARRILVKAGSAVLTNSEGLDRQAIANLVDQITDLHKRGIYTVLVTSGAAAAGRAVLEGRTEVRGIPDRQAAAAGQPRGDTATQQHRQQEAAQCQVVPPTVRR